MGGRDRSSVLGVECFAGSLGEASRAVLERRRAGGGYGVLCNVHVLVSAQHDPALREALDRAWAVFTDGAPVAWLARRLGAGNARRVAGADLMTSLLSEPGLRHFLFGSTPETLARLQERIAREFPEAVVAGAISPPFGDVADESVAEIASATPDIVWCGLGAPKQELWLARHAGELAPAVCLGVGAAFDFLARTRPRAPRWMQRLSLEWLHRLATEPRRLVGRYARTNAEFIVRAGIALSRRKRAA